MSASSSRDAAKELVGKLDSFWKSKRKQAAAQLRILADVSADNKATIAAAGAIPVLVKMLKGSGKTCQELAAGALASLAMDSPPNKDAVIKAGAIKPLVQLLGSPHLAVQQQAAVALRALAAGHEPSAAAIKAAGGVAALSKLADTSKSEMIRWAASGALRHLQPPPPTTAQPAAPKPAAPQAAAQQPAGKYPPIPAHRPAQLAPAPQQQQQQQQPSGSQQQKPAGQQVPPPAAKPSRPPASQNVPHPANIGPQPAQLPAKPSKPAQAPTSEQPGLPLSGDGASASANPAEAAQQPSNAVRRVHYKDLQMGRLLGDQSISSVHQATWRGHNVAVKLILGGARGGGSGGALSESEMQQLIREVRVMAAIQHRNCVRMVGLCTSPAALVTEYCDHGSLTDVLKQARKDASFGAQLTWPRRLHMALDAAMGMLCLHKRQPAVIHSNLKSSNLLVDSKWRVKVADFNLTRVLGDALGSLTAAMDPCWLAPEVIGGDAPSLESDVYSFSVIMWELMTWDVPWNRAAWQVVTLVLEGGRLEVPDRSRLPGVDTPEFKGLDEYVSLMRRCWAQSTFDRPTFSEIVSALGDLLQQASADTELSQAGSGAVRKAGGQDPRYASAAFGAGVMQAISRPSYNAQ